MGSGEWGKTNDAADCQEPDYDHHYFAQLLGVGTLHAVHSYLFEELEADVEVEDCGYAYRTEEAYEDGLVHFFDLVDKFMHSEDYWKTSRAYQYHPLNAARASLIDLPEEENHNTERYQPVDRNDRIMIKHIPRANSTKPNENRQIEQHINRRLQGIIQRLKSKPIVPRECITCDEASQDIVAPNHAACPNNEQRQRNGEHQEALTVHKLPLFSPVQQLLGDPPNCSSVDDAKDDCIAPRLAEPEAYCRRRSTALPCSSITCIFD